MEFLPQAFSALRNFNQFIIYVLTPSKNRPGKIDKLPVDYRSGKVSDAHNPDIWMTADTAITMAKLFGENYGVGFVLTKNDPFWFLDIDNCLAPCGTKWSDIAINLLSIFKGAAIEVSSSGKGLHIIGSGKLDIHACTNSNNHLELYHDGRFIALTGTKAEGDVNYKNPQNLKWLIDTYFSKKEKTELYEWTDQPCEGWDGSLDDNELINRALNHRSNHAIMFNKAQFKDLWELNIDALIATYPDSGKSWGYNRSYADLALAQHLAYWTGNNCERIRRLMLLSALKREKWDREDYLPRTIRTACGRQKDWLCDKPPAKINTETINSQSESLRPVRTQTTTFLSIDNQIDLFSGCAYVRDEHKIMIPGGYLLNPERFRVIYGGYSFPMDNRNERVSRNAWECFTESQAFRSPRADSSCFKPQEDAGKLINQDSQILVNIYWPFKTLRTKGDVTPFLNHLALLFPDKNDQLIILSYMAAIVQYKGIKFDWCPLIQGVQGNGKTFLTLCVAFAVGHRYSHFPKAAEIASKFNAWIYEKIFIGVEDIYVPSDRLEIMEAMKILVTGKYQEIEPKGGEKISKEICANFIINTNHKDGLRKMEDDRRFAPFYTPQQKLSDLKRDKMMGDYGYKLYSWANGGGFAAICELLHVFEIPDEYNPATLCKRAPVTTSTSNAITQSMGSVEQEILEMIDAGSPGFRGGWVSSIMLDRLFEKLNVTRRIPINKRKELMGSLGYEWHPNLKDGRVHNVVQPDNGKPRLYIQVNHPHREIQSPILIQRAYEDAQKNS